MEETYISRERRKPRYWYLPLLLGILYIILGIWVFRTPLEAYLALALLFAVGFLISGIVEIIFAVSNRAEIDNWGWSLAVGIIDLLIGIMLLSRPEITIIILPLYVGFAIMFRSVMAIGWAVELKRQQIGNWGLLLAIGILGIIFSFTMLWNPLLAGLTIVIYTALALLTIGIYQIILAMRLRDIQKHR